MKDEKQYFLITKIRKSKIIRLNKIRKWLGFSTLIIFKIMFETFSILKYNHNCLKKLE